MKSVPRDPEIILKQRRLVLENQRFRVFADHIADSKGNEVPDYLVVAPHTGRSDLVTGICVLPLWKGQVVLLRTYRHAVGRTQLEGVRGFIDEGEDPRAAALRELSEETGLVCTDNHLINLGYCAQEGSTLAARVALFAAENCEKRGEVMEGELGLGVCEYMSLPDAELLVRTMSIEDATTALTLHRYFTWCGFSPGPPPAYVR